MFSISEIHIPRILTWLVIYIPEQPSKPISQSPSFSMMAECIILEPVVLGQDQQEYQESYDQSAGGISVSMHYITEANH